MTLRTHMAGGKKISQRWVVLVSAGILVLAAPGTGSAELPTRGVEVQVRDHVVTIQVNQPTPLFAVLEELCRQAQARCDVQAEDATEIVPPLTIRGGWQEAVAQLLQGTRLNYASLAAAPDQEARLMVGPRPETREEPFAGLPSTAGWGDKARAALKAQSEGKELTSEQASVLERFKRLRSVAGDGTTEGYDSGPTANESLRDSGTEAGLAWPGMPSASENLGGASGGGRDALGWGASAGADSLEHQPLFLGGPPTPPPPGPRMMPFPDEYGNPIPASPRRPTGGPFIDENGNPLRAQPVAPGQRGWQFPDTPPSSGPPNQ